MYKCKKCGKEYETKQQLGGHGKSHSVLPKRKIKLKIEKTHLCKYCLKQFDKGYQLGSHTRMCKLNPKYCERVAMVSYYSRNQIVSQATKDKTSKTITEKIKNGTWHTSLHKGKIYVYNGMKLHGKWEVYYVKYLDDHDIKWSRPTETFPYNFNGKIKHYTPDFYLIDENLYVEVKGYKTYKDECKWNDFPFELKIIRAKEISEYKKYIDDKYGKDYLFYEQYKKSEKLKEDRQKAFQLKIKLRNQPYVDLILNSDIDFSKLGWVNKVAKLINKKQQKINAWMKKYMKDFYEEKCYKVYRKI